MEIGDVVKLKSGSPCMTVIHKQCSSDGPCVEVAYFDDNHVCRTQGLPEKSLAIHHLQLGREIEGNIPSIL